MITREAHSQCTEQWTLGDLIKNLEPHIEKDGSKGFKYVTFGFGSAQPTDFDSWRGDYSHLALGYELAGYDGTARFENCTVKRLLERAKETVGKPFEGWKGGEYVASLDTPIWVANRGNSGGTVIVDMINEGYQIVLLKLIVTIKIKKANP